MLYLSSGACVSTTNIRDHLATLGIDTELRTVQRDLVMFENNNIIPLECRRDSMPHGWCWKKMEGASVGTLNPTTAFALRLIEEQLKDVIPPQLMADLHPLLVQARLFTGVATEMEEIENPVIESPSRQSNIRKGGMEYGLTGGRHSPIAAIWGGIRSRLSSVDDLAEKRNDFKVLNDAVTNLKRIMRDEGLDELVADF